MKGVTGHVRTLTLFGVLREPGDLTMSLDGSQKRLRCEFRHPWGGPGPETLSDQLHGTGTVFDVSTTTSTCLTR